MTDRTYIDVPQHPENLKIAEALPWSDDKRERGVRGTKDQLDFFRLLDELVPGNGYYESSRGLLRDDPFGSRDGRDIDHKTIGPVANVWQAIMGRNILVPPTLGATWYTATAWDERGHLWFVGAVSRETVIQELGQLQRRWGKLLYPVQSSGIPLDWVLLMRGGR